jgi:uncharacterized heparinase superfamily protein
VLAEATAELERIRAPRRAAALDERKLLGATGASTLDELWDEVVERAPFRRRFDAEAHRTAAPEDEPRVLSAATAAAGATVDLLGSGPVTLDRPVDWHCDFATGHRWPPRFWRSIDYVNLDRPSDVKLAWELSRLQWLIPCGQAYLLTGDDNHARTAREVLDDWISANPYAASVNWAVTMEPALRTITVAWLLGALGASDAWSDRAFRFSLLRMLYLHGDFISRNLEWSDVNGNHYTADAAGLAFAGLLFDRPGWHDTGWQILCDELPRQVHEDGVDFEASTAYHRLVAELFLLPALYREQLGLPVPEDYRGRVIAMARFTAAYTRQDGTAPVWGDTDDARALPLGGAPANDHRHLVGTVGAAWSVPDVAGRFSGSRAEVSWLLGAEAAATLPDEPADAGPAAFEEGGVYILASGRDHVFIDCGPVGLSGRGGHGHNDCLSFDAVLDGTHIAVDPGSYVYTASPAWRNRFRSTFSHNTPAVDGVEQATLDPHLMWSLGAEATPVIREFDPNGACFVGAHRGYERLSSPVVVVRAVELDTASHALTVVDRFEGEGGHSVTVPLQLPAGASAEPAEPGRLAVRVEGRRFDVRWGPADEWHVEVEPGWVSPSYGIKHDAPRLRWTRDGALTELRVEIAPAGEEVQ